MIPFKSVGGLDASVHKATVLGGLGTETYDAARVNGFSVQVDGDMQGKKLIVSSSNSGDRFYVVDAITASGLHIIPDDYRYYRFQLDADDAASITITIYSY
jgi:hypothetical protein